VQGVVGGHRSSTQLAHAQGQVEVLEDFEGRCISKARLPRPSESPTRLLDEGKCVPDSLDGLLPRTGEDSSKIVSAPDLS